MDLLTPKPVKSGDRVYIVSPSAGLLPFVAQRLKRAKQHLIKLGFEVVIPANAMKNSGYVSSSIEDRVSDIHAAFNDKKCSLILAAIGGNHSNQLLQHLDYDLISKHPKAFVGYSDNTVLHLAIATQSRLQTFYGPCFLNQFGEFPEVLPYTLSHFKKIIMSKPAHQNIVSSSHYTDEVLDWFKNEDSSRKRKYERNDGYAWWRSGHATGWALPGALPSLNHLVGTRYFPDTKGAILMIDIPEGHTMFEGLSVADFDAWFTDLDNAGVLVNLNGLIISRPYKYSTGSISDLKKVVLTTCKSYDFPILFNADFGHTDPMITIPVGGKVSIDSQKNSFSLL